MPSPDTVVRGQRVVTPGEVPAASIHVSGGGIVGVREFEDVPAGCEVVEAGDSLVLPGLVDSHVHVNEPGRTRWEGFKTATRAAAAGGTTTIVDMPLNSVPPTTTLEGFRQKLEAAAGQCRVDVAFWGGVVPGNLQQLAPLGAAGVVGFKCFLIPSGVEEFPAVTADELRPAMWELARLDAPLIVHPELPGPVERALAACCTGEGGARGLPRPRRASPALPRLRRGGDPGGRDRVKVLPADTRARKPGTVVGRAARRHDLVGRLRPLAVPARDEAARRGRFSEGVGRHLLFAVPPARGLDGGEPPRLRARRPRALASARAGPAGRTRPPQRLDRAGPRRRLPLLRHRSDDARHARDE